MAYKIGEIAKLFGITADTLRYYEKEGLIEPDVNEENGYRMYSLDHVFNMLDITFYRQIGMPVAEIRDLMTSSTRETTIDVLDAGKKIVEEKIRHYEKLGRRIDNYRKLIDEAHEYLGKYEMRPMPKVMYLKTFESREDIPANVLEKCLPGDDNTLFFLTEAFYYDLKEKRTEYYIAVDSQIAEGLDLHFDSAGFHEEEYDNCLFTVCEFKGDAEDIIRRVTAQARRKKLTVTGRIHGIHSYSLYSEDGRKDYYRIFAPVSVND